MLLIEKLAGDGTEGRSPPFPGASRPDWPRVTEKVIGVVVHGTLAAGFAASTPETVVGGVYAVSEFNQMTLSAIAAVAAASSQNANASSSIDELGVWSDLLGLSTGAAAGLLGAAYDRALQSAKVGQLVSDIFGPASLGNMAREAGLAAQLRGDIYASYMMEFLGGVADGVERFGTYLGIEGLVTGFEQNNIQDPDDAPPDKLNLPGDLPEIRDRSDHDHGSHDGFSRGDYAGPDDFGGAGNQC